MLGIIKRNFKYMDEQTFLNLYKTLVRSHLEYASSVWCPYKKGMIDKLEKIQRRATKMITKIKHNPYSERLNILKLPSLSYRRYRGDMIQTYNILTGKYDTSITSPLQINNASSTRGNDLKLKIEGSKHDIRKYSFFVRVPKVWNNLPNSVINSKSVNIFKSNLDKFWANQEVFYDYRAPIM